MPEPLPLFNQQDRRVFSVRNLTQSLREVVESGFSGIWVEGELSNFKRHSSGHCYFTLKDEDAQIRVVLFRGNARHVSFRPQDGMLVQIYGDVSIYEKRGDLQVIARTMKLAGEGALQKAFEALKRKLAAEGLFDKEHKKGVPSFPNAIGVVTSDSGAALHDVLSIIQRRFPQVTVMVLPVQVQGMGAAESIARAITSFNDRDHRPDVLIVGRGGGSLEDLWAFNEEIVARAIFASDIPVISAVGHETDFSISDFVADIRAATPSMAAELAVPDRQELMAAIEKRVSDIQQCLDRAIARYRRHVEYLVSSHQFRRPVDQLRHHTQHADEMAERLNRCALQTIERKRRQTDALRDRLALLGPERPLKRGFALVERSGSIVRRAAELDPGDKVSLQFVDGRRWAHVGDEVDW